MGLGRSWIWVARVDIVCRDHRRRKGKEPLSFPYPSMEASIGLGIIRVAGQ